MNTIKIVTKNNSIQSLVVMKNEEYLDWKEEMIKSEILGCPSHILEGLISLNQGEINHIKKLNKEIATKILYDYLIISGKDEELLMKISRYIYRSILDLKDLMDEGVILNFLIGYYDVFIIK